MENLDPSKICKSDSLLLGRFIKNQSPIINDWQLYLPYDDTLKIDLYNKDGKIVANILDKYLFPGYYRLKLSTHKMSPNMYIIIFKTSKEQIFSKFILLH